MEKVAFILDPDRVDAMKSVMKPKRGEHIWLYFQVVLPPALGLLLVAIAGGYLALAVDGLWLYLPVVALTFLVGVLFFFANVYYRIPKILGSEEHEVAFEEQGIRHIAPRYEVFIPWSGVSNWVNHRDKLLIVTSESSGRFIVVPMDAFNQKGELDAVISRLTLGMLAQGESDAGLK